MRKSKFQIIFAVFLPLKLCLCPAKLWGNADFAPQNYGAMQTLPCKIMEPLFFAPQKYGAFILCPAKLWSNAHFAPQSQRNSFRGQSNNRNYLKIRFSSIFSNYFCKSMLFQRSIQPLGPVFKENIFCVTVPLKWIESTSQ